MPWWVFLFVSMMLSVISLMVFRLKNKKLKGYVTIRKTPLSVRLTFYMTVICTIAAIISAVFPIWQYGETNAAQSETELLRKATIAYNGKDYESVFTILTSDELHQNPYNILNLGYMFEQGLGVEPNIDTAIEKYRMAMSLDVPESYQYLFNVLLENYPKQAVNMLDELMMNSTTSRNAGAFLNGLKIDADSFSRKDMQEKKSFLLSLFTEWETSSIASPYLSVMSDTDTTDYVLKSSRYQYITSTEPTVIMVYYYIVYKRIIVGLPENEYIQQL